MVECDVKCPWELKGKVMRLLMKESENRKRDFVDGIKIYFDSGEAPSSVFVMPDKERAVFHLRAEAVKDILASTLADEYEKKILEWEGRA